MGLFSNTYTTYVDSVVYNLAGDPVDRVNFLKTTVSAAALKSRSHKRSIADDMVKAQMSGPHMHQQRMFRWARDNYPEGTPVVQITGEGSVDETDIAGEMPHPVGTTVELIDYSLGDADFFRWADQWIVLNQLEDRDTNWTVDINPEETEITIQFEDTSTQVVPLTNFDREGRYLYVEYSINDAGVLSQAYEIYKFGDGNAVLDAMDTSSAELPEFYPFIPLRVNNVSVRNPIYASLFPNMKKAYSRATSGRSIDVILDGLEENDGINDIDYAFVVYGVPLNATENAPKQYIYEFFKRLIPFQGWTEVEYLAWAAAANAASNNLAKDPPINTIRVNGTSGPAENYDTRLNWVLVDEVVGTGLGKVGAVPGELWFQALPNQIYKHRKLIGYTDANEFPIYSFLTNTVENYYLWHQLSPSSWRRLTLRGVSHTNYVYKTQSTFTKMSEALADSEESGFIVPMHYPSVRNMPLAKATQVSMGNALLVLNSYKTVKTRWYERGFFRILLIIGIAIVGAFFFPAAAGLLGTNLAVGTALGFTGTTALIIGGVVNAIAASILMTVIEEVAVGALGEEFGLGLTALISMITFRYVSNYFNGGGFNMNWADMMKAENIMKLADSVTGAIRGWAEDKLGDINEEMQSSLTRYESSMEEIEKKTMELLGYGGGMINPLMFTQMQDPTASFAESSDTFLGRTLMTGSEVVGVSISMIENFADLSLELPKPIA